MPKEVIGDTGMTKYTYAKCPACGSKKRHYEDACERAIKMNVAPPGYLVPFSYNERIIADPIKEAVLPLGAELPSITSALEICKQCGCVYAPMVITGKAKKSLTTGGEQAKERPKIYLPGQ